MENTPQLENGYTPIANEILERLCEINLTSYQFRILLYIFRKTYGFHKKEDWISVSQIVEATGIKQSHVSRTKKELVAKSILYTPTGIKVAFQKDWRLWNVDIPNEVYRKNIPNQDKNIPNEDKNIPVQGDTKNNIQKIITKEREFSHIEDISEIIVIEIAEKYQVSPEFVWSKLDDIRLWHEENPKRNNKKNWKATLMKWVKKDSKGGGTEI